MIDTLTPSKIKMLVTLNFTVVRQAFVYTLAVMSTGSLTSCSALNLFVRGAQPGNDPSSYLQPRLDLP